MATDVSWQAQLRRLRESYPVFHIEDARATCSHSTVTLEFRFAAGEMRFRPVVELGGLCLDEATRVDSPTARRLIRALAIIEAFSYWKAFCSPVIEVALPAPDAAELAWWRSFWPGAMGEFFYRNAIDFTTPGFLDIKAATGAGPAAGGAPPDPANTTDGSTATTKSPLVMFSGGKDSLALTLAIRGSATSPVDFFLYNPTSQQRGLAESLAAGGRIFEVRREILPELLALNAANHPNGHTPYSAYLAVAAMLAGYLRGSQLVLVGNSRSDDEPNIESYLGRPVNHQWTKSHEFEAALRNYRDRWLPGAPVYSSPLRPLFELQIIASLSGDIDAYLQTASCNRTRGEGWCRTCAKCAWVFLATSALFGHQVAIRKTGSDLFANPDLAELYERMAGLTSTKPFECTGTEDEIRVAIRAIGQGHSPDDFPALATCLRNHAVTTARPLAALLADWGRDDLVPGTLTGQIRKAVSRTPPTYQLPGHTP
ncbi:MAG: hypothetical protein ACRDSZ_02720 [Pseudonocardiaceae bacterium]